MYVCIKIKKISNNLKMWLLTRRLWQTVEQKTLDLIPRRIWKNLTYINSKTKVILFSQNNYFYLLLKKNSR
jgi:hypothetical protein